MNKQEFLTALRNRLRDLPEEDIRRALDYYGEILADRIDEGLTEQEAVAALGTLEEIETQIRQDAGPAGESRAPSAPRTPEHGNPAGRKTNWVKNPWFWVAMVLLSPIWIGLLAGLVGLILGLLGGLLGLYAGVVGLFAGALGCLILPVIHGYPLEMLVFSLGAGLVCLGLGVLMLFAVNAITRGCVKLCKLGIEKWKTLWNGKEHTV